MRLIDADKMTADLLTVNPQFETWPEVEDWNEVNRMGMIEIPIERREPVMRWIPCEERLPEDYTDVLVWFEYFRYGDYNCLYQTYGIGDYIANYGWMINHETGWHKLRVIAWMPLPEPYQGEGEQDEIDNCY